MRINLAQSVFVRLTGEMTEIFQTADLKTCFSQVFNFKIGSFASEKSLSFLHKRSLLKLKMFAPNFVLFALIRLFLRMGKKNAMRGKE